jgi:hypothetical protein
MMVKASIVRKWWWSVAEESGVGKFVLRDEVTADTLLALYAPQGIENKRHKG